MPVTLITVNGPTFCGKIFQDFVKSCGIKHIRTAAYHPASNGAAENAVRTFKSKFSLLIKANNDKHDALVKFLFHWRSSPHCTTGVSPAELQCNYKFRTKRDLLKLEVGGRVVGKQNEQKHHFSGNINVEFRDGEVVMAKDYSNDKWRQAEITHKLGPVTYAVQTNDNRHWKKDADQLRHCNLPSITLVHNKASTLGDSESNALNSDVVKADRTILQNDNVPTQAPNCNFDVNDEALDKSISNKSHVFVDESSKQVNQSADNAVTFRRSSRTPKPRELLNL